MRKALFIVSILTSLTITAFGQKNKTPSQPDGDVTKRNERPVGTASVLGSAQGSGQLSSASGVINAGSSIEGQLQNDLDVRRSHVGDMVVLKTVKAVKQNGETIVPKGSQLVGRITEITQRSKNSSESRIGMVFERVQGRDLSFPLSASIVSISSAASSISAASVMDSDISGSASSSSSVSRGSGGGLLGGGVAPIGAVTSTASSTLGGVSNTVGGLTNSTSQTLGGTTRAVGSTVNGVRIGGTASGSANASSTISSGDKNLHIEKGATFNLIVNK